MRIGVIKRNSTLTFYFIVLGIKDGQQEEKSKNGVVDVNIG